MFRRHFHRRVVAYFFVCTIFVMGMVFGSLAVRHVAVEQREELRPLSFELLPDLRSGHNSVQGSPCPSLHHG